MNLRDFKFTGAALVIILIALASTKGGLQALVPLLRFALPFVALFLAYRFVKGKVIAAAQNMQRQAQQQGRPGPGGGGPVIDLCPKCGKYMTGQHRC